MAFIDVDKVNNDGREYRVGLEEIGFIKGKIIKSGNEVDGVALNFTPKCELIIYSSTSKYNMNFASIYFETHNSGKDKFQTILNILKTNGLVGLLEYIKNINPNNYIEKNDDICTSSNTELARIHLDFV